MEKYIRFSFKMNKQTVAELNSLNFIPEIIYFFHAKTAEQGYLEIYPPISLEELQSSLPTFQLFANSEDWQTARSYLYSFPDFIEEFPKLASSNYNLEVFEDLFSIILSAKKIWDLQRLTGNSTLFLNLLRKIPIENIENFKHL